MRFFFQGGTTSSEVGHKMATERIASSTSLSTFLLFLVLRFSSDLLTSTLPNDEQRFSQASPIDKDDWGYVGIEFLKGHLRLLQNFKFLEILGLWNCVSTVERKTNRQMPVEPFSSKSKLGYANHRWILISLLQKQYNNTFFLHDRSQHRIKVGCSVGKPKKGHATRMFRLLWEILSVGA